MNSRPSNGVKKDRLKLEHRRREDVDELGISLATLGFVDVVSRTGTVKKKEGKKRLKGAGGDKGSIRSGEDDGPREEMARYIYIHIEHGWNTGTRGHRSSDKSSDLFQRAIAN